jgi:hypothetical protein
MDFVNETNVEAGWTVGFQRDGRELVVVVIKATFLISNGDGEAPLAAEQVKLVEADQFSGEPGRSAPVYESDFAHRKPFCDVLVNARAYAAGGRPTHQVSVGVKVATMVKTFAVTGNRVWQSDIVGVSATTPELFTVVPISYDNAFGGADVSKDDPQNVRTYLENPVGRGYSYFKRNLDGRPLPNTEEFRKPVEKPNGNYRPMSFGPIGRNWQPRTRFAGTYGQDWLDYRAPFWPDDFDDRYFQAAPSDQQIPYPTGGEEVLLRNLSTDGYVSFKLPTVSMPVLFVPYRGRAEQLDSVIDTVVIEPDLGRFTMTWRVSYPLRRNCFELMRIVAGKTSREWMIGQRFPGKPYYRGLSELIRAKSPR